MRHTPSQHSGPAAGTTLMTLAAPGVPKGRPAVTTRRSSGETTRPFWRAARHALRRTVENSSSSVSVMAAGGGERGGGKGVSCYVSMSRYHRECRMIRERERHLHLSNSGRAWLRGGERRWGEGEKGEEWLRWRESLSSESWGE